MKILRSDLDTAAQNGILTSEQAQQLWIHLETSQADHPQFHALHVLYYFGGVLILASMSWFLTNAWDNGSALMAISGFFALIYLLIGRSLWAKPNFKIPGGLLITAAVGLTPVFVYGFQKATGLWPQTEPGSYHDFHVWVKGGWFAMEIATVITALIALRFFKFAFLTFPLAFTLWYMSMDITPLIFGETAFNSDQRKWVSVIFGFAMLVSSYFVDRKYRKIDFAFWTYLYALLAFWGGLSMMDSDSELNKLIYCLINLVLMMAAVYLRRRVMIVFGTIGVLGYLGHLAWKVFKDSYTFPIALSVLGIGIVFLGVKYQKNQAQFEGFIENLFPRFLSKWRPEQRI